MGQGGDHVCSTGTCHDAGVALDAWVYISKDSGAGGGGRLRRNLRKVKDLVNNASILTIFSLKLCNFLQNFL